MPIPKTLTCVDTVRLGVEASDDEWHSAVQRSVEQALAECHTFLRTAGIARSNCSALSVATAALPPAPNGVQLRLLVTTLVALEESHNGA